MHRRGSNYREYTHSCSNTYQNKTIIFASTAIVFGCYGYIRARYVWPSLEILNINRI